MREYNEIERLVLAHFRLTKIELYSKNRKAIYVDARRVMMYLLRKEMFYSLKEIGKIFMCDHATVIHHVRKMEYLKDQEPIKYRFDLIMETLNYKPVKLTDQDALKRIMESIVWEEKGTTRKNLEKLLETNLAI